MNKYFFIFWSIFLLTLWSAIWYFWYIYMPKINYHTFLLTKQKERQSREDIKVKKLQKQWVFFVKNYNFKTSISLNLYKDYVVLNGKFCDIHNEFFIKFEEELKSKNILYKPKINLNEHFQFLWYQNVWKRIKKENLKHNICQFILSDKNIEMIEIELENYEYSSQEIQNLSSYILVGTYKINKYHKTPQESIWNSQNLIDKISYELIYPQENISLLEKLLQNGWKDLLKSNILKDGEIIQWIWWWSCLASTIIYRTLLSAGVKIKSQKTHNIYYQNIYWVHEIGLDSTIYEDEQYYVDLLFQNNYQTPIFFIPKFTDTYIQLDLYAQKKEFYTQLTPIDSDNIANIKWNYEVFNINNDRILHQTLSSKYDSIDNF